MCVTRAPGCCFDERPRHSRRQVPGLRTAYDVAVHAVQEMSRGADQFCVLGVEMLCWCVVAVQQAQGHTETGKERSSRFRSAS